MNTYLTNHCIHGTLIIPNHIISSIGSSLEVLDVIHICIYTEMIKKNLNVIHGILIIRQITRLFFFWWRKSSAQCLVGSKQRLAGNLIFLLLCASFAYLIAWSNLVTVSNVQINPLKIWEHPNQNVFFWYRAILKSMNIRSVLYCWFVRLILLLS